MDAKLDVSLEMHVDLWGKSVTQYQARYDNRQGIFE